jgi:hypothetical protein
MSLDRKGEDRALTESIVVITEKGTCKSFSPTEFNRTFHVRRSETGSKPMSIRNDSLQCLAIPRPAKGVSKDVHTGVPKSKAEYDKSEQPLSNRSLRSPKFSPLKVGRGRGELKFE